MIRLISYSIYIILLGYFLARWFGVKAYEGFYTPVFFITVTYVIAFLIGEAIRPRTWVNKMFIVIPGAIVIVMCIAGGHYFGYQKTVRLVADSQRSDSTSAIDYSKYNDVEVFNEYTRSLVGKPEIDGIAAYLNYHSYLGFIEYPKIQSAPSTGFWVYFSWVFQITMLSFGLYVLYQAIDTEYISLREKQKKKSINVEPEKAKVQETVKPTKIVDPLVDSLFNYLREAKTDWRNSKGTIIDKKELFKASRFEELNKLGFGAQSLDNEGRSILYCLLHDRKNIDLVLKYLDDEEERLQERFVEEYGHNLLLFADVYEPVRSWGIHSYFDERFPPSYSTKALRKLEVKAVHFIKLGADINQRNDQGATPFMLYSRSTCSIEFYTWLFKRGADVRAEDKLGRTALFYAAQRKGEEFNHVKLLIKSGVDVLARDRQDKTVFHNVAAMGRESLFWLLFEEVPENKKAEILSECLPETTRSTNAEFLRNLTAKEKSFQSGDGYNETDLGHTLWERDVKNALWVRDKSSLKAIFEEGGDYHLSRAEEAVNTAVAYSYLEGLKLLIDHGASLRNFPKGYTPYMVMAFKRPSIFPTEILSVLEPFKIPPDAVDDFDCSALDYLSGVNHLSEIKEEKGTIELAKYLLTKGANPNRVSSKDQLSAKDRASKKGLEEMAKLFEQNSKTKD